MEIENIEAQIGAQTFSPNEDYGEMEISLRKSAIQTIGTLVKAGTLTPLLGAQYRYALEKYKSDLAPPDISNILPRDMATVIDLGAGSGGPTARLYQQLQEGGRDVRVIAIERSRTLGSQMVREQGAQEINLGQIGEQKSGLYIVCGDAFSIVGNVQRKVDVVTANFVLDRVDQYTLLKQMKLLAFGGALVACEPLQYSSPDGNIVYVPENQRIVPAGDSDLCSLSRYFQNPQYSNGNCTVTTLQDGKEEFQWAGISGKFAV